MSECKYKAYLRKRGITSDNQIMKMIKEFETECRKCEYFDGITDENGIFDCRCWKDCLLEKQGAQQWLNYI